jgi:hypothetical protein
MHLTSRIPRLFPVEYCFRIVEKSLLFDDENRYADEANMSGACNTWLRLSAPPDWIQVRVHL